MRKLSPILTHNYQGMMFKVVHLELVEANEFIKAQLRAGKIKLKDGSVLRLDIDKAPEIMSEIQPWEATTMAERLKLELYNIAVQSKP